MYIDIQGIAWMVLLLSSGLFGRSRQAFWKIGAGDARREAAERDMKGKRRMREREAEVRARGEREGWL